MPTRCCKKYQMKAVISIIVGETDKYSELDENKENYSHITWDMINEMMESGLIEIQNHTYNLHKTGNPRGAAQRKDETTEQYFCRRGRRSAKSPGPHRGDDQLAAQYLYLSVWLLQPPQPGTAGAAGLCCFPRCGGQACCLTRDPACLIRILRYTRTSQKTAEELLCHFWD